MACRASTMPAIFSRSLARMLSSGMVVRGRISGIRFSETAFLAFILLMKYFIPVFFLVFHWSCTPKEMGNNAVKENAEKFNVPFLDVRIAELDLLALDCTALRDE